MAETPRGRKARSRTLVARGRKVSIREDARSVEVRVDGVPIHVEKLGPSRYHSHVVMFRDYDDLDELLDAVLAEEGTLWLLEPPPPDHGHGSHRHGAPPAPGHGHDHDG